jgi:Integrase core domain
MTEPPERHRRGHARLGRRVLGHHPTGDRRPEPDPILSPRHRRPPRRGHLPPIQLDLPLPLPHRPIADTSTIEVLRPPLEITQFTSARFTERLDEIGARPSIGTVADSYDHALAETTNGLYKSECVYGPDTDGWDDVDQLELATLSWVHWFNEQRLHSHCGHLPPAEFEAAFYAAQQPDPAQVGIQ